MLYARFDNTVTFYLPFLQDSTVSYRLLMLLITKILRLLQNLSFQYIHNNRNTKCYTCDLDTYHEHQKIQQYNKYFKARFGYLCKPVTSENISDIKTYIDALNAQEELVNKAK